MPDPAPGLNPVPIPVPEAWVRITNIGPNECIPLEFDVTVDYSPGNLVNVGLTCGGVALPDQAAQGASTRTFHLIHGAADVGKKHTLVAGLKNAAGATVVSDTIGSVGIGNPCPINITTDGVWRGLPVVDPTKAVAGTFAPKVGNRIFVQVYQPGTTVKGVYQPPVLVFAGQAEADVKQGEWKHGPINVAKRGYYLRAILTQNGEVKCIVRGIFK